MTYLSNKTGVQIDTITDNADAGNIGKQSGSEEIDLNAVTNNKYFYAANTTTNTPIGGALHGMSFTTNSAQYSGQLAGGTSGALFYRNQTAGAWQPWRELYHTGNTSVVKFGSGVPASGASEVNIGRGNKGTIDYSNSGTGLETCCTFLNPNGTVGSIQTNASATVYNTSSDPRLKNFTEAPADNEINDKFNSLFSAFKTFNWKSDPEGDLVWGFDAHACIDAGLDMGSEGEGPRNLELGEVYETIPAVTEQRVVTDEDGSPTNEIETVEIEAAVEKKVSPAGVDQSKAVPILLAKIEQLERRLSALES